MNSAIFTCTRPGRDGWQMQFTHPTDMWLAHTHGEVATVLHQAERAACAGKWVAVLLAYEAAPAFDPAFAVQPAGSLPLACAAAFDQLLECGSHAPAFSPEAVLPETREPSYSTSPWTPKVDRAAFVRAVERIREYIAAGDVYQVNYTFPLECRFEGDPASWFRDLCAAQQAEFCVYADLGQHVVLSISPELFLERRGTTLAMRPMKGTAPRGRWADEDARCADGLLNSAKNRAENIMIVDLIRNDLGRIADIGSVHVPRLFDIEKYPTVWQMTSTVEARQRADASLVDIVGAVFPCGSITGAPTIRAMQVIRELEPFARGIYTGCIGLLEPGGDFTFNVAIRTVVVDREARSAVFGVGGGIVWDSQPDDEYEECANKSLFLLLHKQFSLFETLLLEEGKFFLLDKHVARVKASASFFGFVLDEGEVLKNLCEAKDVHPTGQWKVRMVLAPNGNVTVEAEPLSALRLPRRVAFAAAPIKSSNVFCCHKTTSRSVYDEALKSRPDADDVLLWNERGEVTESTIANIVVEKQGRKWTPPRTCGLLNGTFREELLESGEISEKVLTKEDVRNADRIHLVNSVRKWIPAKIVN